MYSNGLNKAKKCTGPSRHLDKNCRSVAIFPPFEGGEFTSSYVQRWLSFPYTTCTNNIATECFKRHIDILLI